MTPELQQEREQAKQIDLDAASERVHKALHPDAFAARTQRMDAIAAESKKSGVAYNANYDGPPIISGEKWEPIKPPKPTRAKPIKGVCTFCGKHYSRHYPDGEGHMFCKPYNKDVPSHQFSLERKHPDPPVQAGGKLSAEQAQQLMNLLAEKEIARVQWESAVALEEDTNAKFVDAEAAVLAFIRDHTA